MALTRAWSISFLGVGTPTNSPISTTAPHRWSTSVFLPAMISCSIEHLLSAVFAATSLSKSSKSNSERSVSYTHLTLPTKA